MPVYSSVKYIPASFFILSSVTLTGMAVLIVEIAAARILTPYFGNSIFTFSSVISIILGALAIGYYLGGRLADRRPSERVFFTLILLSGVAVMLLQILNHWLLPQLGYRLSMTHGPLLVSPLLFFLPAVLLGSLSPFSIRLLYQAQQEHEVGSVSGLVFFWSTLGSILGSLAAGFWLIPEFGVSRIIIGVGAGLICLGAVGLAIFSSIRRDGLSAVILAVCGLSWLLAQWQTTEAEGTRFSDQGLYEKIVVRDLEYQGRPTRVLMQDRNINSGMFIDDGRMAFGYTRYFDLYRLFQPDLKRALVIGGGAYSVPKAILHNLPAAIVDVAEIEPKLLPLAHEYFGLPKSDRLNNHVVDGRRFLHDSRDTYDLIFVDVYSAFASVPMQFTTQEYFQLVNTRLNTGGVYIANFYGSLSAEVRPVLQSIYKTMRDTFPALYLLAVEDRSSEKLQNFIFIGHRTDGTEPVVKLSRARTMDFAYDELQQVDERLIKPARKDLAMAPVLTDDFAPVETYAAAVIRQLEANQDN